MVIPQKNLWHHFSQFVSVSQVSWPDQECVSGCPHIFHYPECRHECVCVCGALLLNCLRPVRLQNNSLSSISLHQKSTYLDTWLKYKIAKCRIFQIIQFYSELESFLNLVHFFVNLWKFCCIEWIIWATTHCWQYLTIVFVISLPLPLSLSLYNCRAGPPGSGWDWDGLGARSNNNTPTDSVLATWAPLIIKQ